MRELRHAPDLDIAIDIIAAARALEALWRVGDTFNGVFNYNTRAIISIFCSTYCNEPKMKTTAEFREAHEGILYAIERAKENRAQRGREAAERAAQDALDRSFWFRLRKWFIYFPLLLIAAAFGNDHD